jgi:hypothetical protein
MRPPTTPFLWGFLFVCASAKAPANETDAAECIGSKVLVVGVEGTSHHGMLELLPALKALSTHETDSHCLHIDWMSYPARSRGLNEAARLSLLYGDSCEWHGASVWKHNNCATQGNWRCGSVSDPGPLHRELVWRFSSHPALEGLDIAASKFGFKILVLRRDLVRSTLSHNHDSRRPWDGSYESHAMVLASFTTIIRYRLLAFPVALCSLVRNTRN